MTRILRFLIIAAVAWPFFGNTAAAQEVVSVNETCTTVKKSPSDNFTGNTQILNAEPNVNHAYATTIDNGKTIKVAKGVKVQTKPRVVKVTKSRANVPEGYSLITLIVLDTGESGTGVWNDGTGYQMLLDVDHDTYGSTIPATGALTTSGDVPASTYALFEYKIPENADGALSTTNILVSGSQSITIPAGTYDWCITNPTPEARMWIASEQGAVQGRYDDYVFESGFAYTFTISLVGQNDNVEIGITSNYDNPTNLVASDITNHQATITWSPGGDETSWNVQYKKKADYEWTSVGSLTSANYLMEGLDGLTLYQARVQSVYSGGLSGWEMVTFKTANNAVEFCEPKDMGEISYTLTDSYGDGWNGAAINIVDAESGTIIESITLSSGESAEGTVNICYGRTVNFVWTAGSYPGECSFKLTDPDGEVIYEASTTNCNSFADGYVFKSSYMMTMPDPTQSLDFGVVDVNTSKTLTAYVKNDSNNDVQAALTITAPFTVASSSVTMQPGLTKIPVTFTPVDAVNYNGTLTIDINGENTTITLTGVGNVSGSPAALRDSTFFAGITYEWTDSTGVAHTSNLSEIATDPDQMIAMMKEIYTNKSIPGTYKRGYTATGGSEGYGDVYYSGVGEITRGSGYNNASYYSYSDAYGWDIPGNIKYNSYSTGSITYYYAHLDTVQYKPNQEGMTLLLVEVVDDYKKSDVTYTSGNNTYWETFDDDNYLNLRQYVVRTIKSVRVITEAKRTGKKSDFTSGSLFKIDCDKMNKFFLLGKGQARWVGNSYWADYTSGSSTYNIVEDFCAPPCYIYSSSRIDKYVDKFGTRYFYHMFEQFSPVASDASIAKADIYQDLVNMNTFGVEHDCMSIIPSQGHQFMMYGDDSDAADCQDVRDLMFFVPDYRMMKDDGRDPTGARQKFLNYNTTHKPTMGLFVIKQNPITGEQIDGQDTYKLHLTWTSNLLDFLPGEDGKYTLYRVITNPDGTKTYQKVGNFDPNTLEYYDNVPMQQNGQQVTYVVQGQDAGEFLDLQMSNEESFIIPGLDRAEQIRIELNSDYYFSRYDAADQTNNYSNSLIANNTVGTNVKAQYIENGSQFKFWRATIDEQTGNVVTPDEPFVVAEVSNWNPATGGTLTYKDWKGQTDFSSKPYGHGYHANPATSTISVANGDVVFDGLKLYDNFSVDVSENAHPAQYVYYVTLETAVPFELAGNGIPSCATIQSGTYAYFECAWGSTMRAWAWNEAGNLTGTNWPGSGTMTQVGTHNGNKVWLWTADASVQPTNIIFNWDNASSLEQTGTYTFVNGGYYKHESDVVSVVESNQARSNTVSVPVYKTGMTMNPISAQDVENDVTHQFPAATKFDVKARYSSKSEILGYYIYRWADSDPEQPRTIYESDGGDASPQGQAGNQSEYYSVAMNTDFTGRTENFGANYADVTASFEDNFVVNQENADTYTYAPVVELFAPEPAVNLPSGADRVDYNTYGGPQQMTAGGVVKVQVLKPAQSEYTWTANGKTYTYYNVFLDITTLDLPAGYEVAKVRAWRKIDSQYLGEQKDKGYEGRLDLDVNGEYKFVEHATCAEGEELGSTGSNNVFEGTFGAVKLNPGEEIPMDFVVRVYFTKSVSGAKAADPNGDYYIAEYTISDALTSDIPTSINGVESYRNVESVKYYNGAGIESDTPFQGVNIVVTRYSDGSTTTTKILK